MKVGILAGEASGDLLGSHLLKSLKKRFPDLEAVGMGGPLMQAEGCVSLFPMDRLSIMGFVEPFKRLPELLRMRGALYRHFRDDPPDVFIGIDSPDFNLHLEQKLRKCGIKTVHMVSPSVWAWRQGRVKKVARAVDLMLTLFPFEADFYREHQVPVEYIGHPLADELPLETDRLGARGALGIEPDATVVGLLPGSRGGELRMLGGVFLDAARQLHAGDGNMRFVIPAANEQRHGELLELLRAYPELPVQLLNGRSREAMAASNALMLASGTATLEAALLKRPMTVAYKFAPLSHFILSFLVKTPFASLPNLLVGRELVRELIQKEVTAEALAAQTRVLLSGAQELDAPFNAIHQQLRRGASDRAADAIVQLCGKPTNG